jgi:hypothetical protein
MCQTTIPHERLSLALAAMLFPLVTSWGGFSFKGGLAPFDVEDWKKLQKHSQSG